MKKNGGNFNGYNLNGCCRARWNDSYKYVTREISRFIMLKSSYILIKEEQKENERKKYNTCFVTPTGTFFFFFFPACRR